MASYVVRGLGVILTAAVFALSAAPRAEATINLENCTITALTPTPVFLSPTGRKLADGRAEVRCTTQRTVLLQIALYGDDPLSDDSLGWHYHQARQVGPTAKIWGGFSTNTLKPDGHPCNEDIGGDELYGRVRATLGSTAGPWSHWERGPTVTYSC